MRRSWNDIRARAAAFAREWAGRGSERQHTQIFYQGFFDIFGISVQRVASFEEPVKKLGERRGYIDLLWKGVLLVEQKSEGRNLKKALEQAFGYFPGLREDELPRYILVSDFKSFELYDIVEDEHFEFTLAELPKHVERFGFIIGVQRREFKDQDPVNIEAAELIGALHDALADSGYNRHDRVLFLVRIVFCLFADNTGVFETRCLLLDFLEERTDPDGSDVGPLLVRLFQVLDTPEAQRQKNLDEDIARFPYINGDLFKIPLSVTPDFNREMRMQLIAASRFDWSKVSPAIFGSLFQSVMDTKKRRAVGAHYTSEKNILKLIEPLFLDALRAEFQKLKNRKDSRRVDELRKFHEKLGRLKFLDPACGCGNFLVIAYRKLRELEMEVIRTRMSFEKIRGAGALFEGTDLLRLDVDQFYGIEIEEFPARIAETALWMMDHIMNNELSLEFGESYVRIPLKKSPHIQCADALEMEWAELLPPTECSFVFGNPPFGGAKFQSKEQRAQVHRIANLGGAGGTLDYVTAWFFKAGQYISPPPPPRGNVRASPSSLQTPSRRANKLHSCGRSCLSAVSWSSLSRTKVLRGPRTRAARLMCMSSSLDFASRVMHQHKSGSFLTPTPRANRMRATPTCYHRIFSMRVDSATRDLL